MRGLLRWGWGRTGREEEKLWFGMGVGFTKFVLSNIFAVFSWCKGRGVFGVGKVGFLCVLLGVDTGITRCSGDSDEERRTRVR